MTSEIKVRRGTPGFTLIELLVVIGIIALLIGLLLPAYGLITRKANATRARADLNTIATALSAYKDDFQGAYPQVIGVSPNVANTRVEGTGAHVLCQALFGLGPAYPDASGQWIGNDGADGPGFRLRRTIDDAAHQAYTNAVPPTPLQPAPPQVDGVPDSFGGRVYGPYLRPESFRFDTDAPFSDPDKIRILDHTGSPILYYSASQPNMNLSATGGPLLAWPFDATKPVIATPMPKTSALSVGNNYRPLFNIYDNSVDQATPTPNPQINQTQMLVMLGDYNTNQLIDGTEPSGTSVPFILWSRGPDGQFGPNAALLGNGSAAAESNRLAAQKCDDITNLP